MRTTPRPTTYKPPSIPSHPLLPKKLTKEELCDRLAKGLCWHYDKPWSRDHRCKKGHLLLIEPIEDMEEEVQEHKSGLSVQHLLATTAISAFCPHQSSAIHATVVLLCRGCMTMLLLFFPCYSSVGHTAAALLYNNRALLCPFFPLSQPHLCCNHLYHSRLQTTTTSTCSHAVAPQP
ncbi:hypothetical protein BHM03_00038283 [Ensete ventricosum]|nr:hypothetical protein BHM03_00038283 [Ensete ventricosum]